jgi:hypothetical protein
MDELREAKYLAFGRDQPFVDVFNDVGRHELPFRPEGYRNQRTPESRPCDLAIAPAASACPVIVHHFSGLGPSLGCASRSKIPACSTTRVKSAIVFSLTMTAQALASAGFWQVAAG